jgi:hypothetical protein
MILHDEADTDAARVALVDDPRLDHFLGERSLAEAALFLMGVND